MLVLLLMVLLLQFIDVDDGVVVEEEGVSVGVVVYVADARVGSVADGVACVVVTVTY
jgi:hypothetical protein